MLIVVLTAGHAFAQAQPSAEARRLHREGQASYAAGQYEDALQSWQRAFELSHRAAIQYNLSQAYGRLNRLAEEREALVLFLRLFEQEAPDRMNDPQVLSAQQRIHTIDERVMRTGILVHEVPEGAIVYLDDAPAILDEGFVATDAGSHALRVEQEGFVPFQAAVTVTGGSRAEVTVQMLPVEVEVVEVDLASHRHHRNVAVGLLVAGGATLAAGTTLGVIAMGRARGTFRGTDDARSARGLAIGADVAFGVGAALTTTSFILWRVHHGEADRPVPVAAPTAGGAMVGVAGRF